MSALPLPACNGTTDDNGNNAFACALSRGQSIGLAFVAEAGAISLVSCVLLLILIIRNVLRYKRYYRGENGRWSLFHGPADVYVFSLFLADLIQSVGAFLDVKWVHVDVVHIGAYCTAQGAIQQLGETVVALNTIVISIHTFVVVWFRKGVHRNRGVAFIVIGLVWLFVILWVVIGSATNKNYYNPTPYWCWIGGRYKGQRLAGEYVWLWAALTTAVLVYVPLFLWNLGWIDVEETRWWRLHLPSEKQPELHNSYDVRARPNAPTLALLAYPVAYSIVILPVSVVRWSSFSGRHVPDWATFFSVFMHDMFGATNVALLLLTKPNLLLFVRPEEADEHGMAGPRRSGDALRKDEDSCDGEPSYAMQESQSSEYPQIQANPVLRRSEDSSSSSMSRLGG